jgi:hypothetical protein
MQHKDSRHAQRRQRQTTRQAREKYAELRPIFNNSTLFLANQKVRNYDLLLCCRGSIFAVTISRYIPPIICLPRRRGSIHTHCGPSMWIAEFNLKPWPHINHTRAGMFSQVSDMSYLSPVLDQSYGCLNVLSGHVMQSKFTLTNSSPLAIDLSYGSRSIGLDTTYPCIERNLL